MVFLDFLGKRKMRQRKKTGQWICTNDGQINYCWSEAEKKGFSASSFCDAIDQLVERGFLDIHHQGCGGRKGDKSTYGFSERWREFDTPQFRSANRKKVTARVGFRDPSILNLALKTKTKKR